MRERSRRAGWRRFVGGAVLVFAIGWLLWPWGTPSLAAQPPSSARSRAAIARVLPTLERDLAERELRFGAPVFIRILEETSERELFVEAGGRFRLFRIYPVCAWSGTLGPKLREGDGQAPEGFYALRPPRE